jgi:hypothetical protein
MLKPFITLDSNDKVEWLTQPNRVLGSVVIGGSSLDPIKPSDWMKWIGDLIRSGHEIFVHDANGRTLGVAASPRCEPGDALYLEIREPKVKWEWGEETYYDRGELIKAIEGFCIEELSNSDCGSVTEMYTEAGKFKKGGVFNIRVIADLEEVE